VEVGGAGGKPFVIAVLLLLLVAVVAVVAVIAVIAVVAVVVQVRAESTRRRQFPFNLGGL
jgi:hypothetical protein